MQPRRRIAALAIVTTLCLSTTPASASRPVRLIGTLVMVHEGPTMHYFLDVGGRLSRELTFPTTQNLRPGAALEVTGVGHGDTVAVTGVSRLSAPRTAAPLTLGTRKLLVILVEWSSSTITTTRAGANTFVFGTTDPQRRSVVQWYEDVSYGQLEWTGDVTPILRIADPGTCSLGVIANRSDTAAATAGYTLANYDDRMYDFPAGYCDNSYGEIAGPRSWIEDGLVDPGNPSFDPNDEGYQRMIPDHELGHNLGEYHGHGLDCGADTLTTACAAGASGAAECDFGGSSPCVSEYGDAYDVMGNNWTGEETSQQGVNWFGIRHEMRLGWVSGRTITDNQPATSQDQAFTIEPIERGTGDIGLTLNTSAGRTYVVEYRQAIGQDAFLTQYPAATTGVQISMVNPVAGFGSDTGLTTLDAHPDSDRSTLYSDWFDAPLQAGETFSDPGGAFTLSLDSASTSGASMTVHWVGASGVTALDQMDPSVTYNGWRGVADAAANGGGYRFSRVKNDTATWSSPATTSLSWITRTGPDEGRATLSIDGVNKGTFDLYSASPAGVQKIFSGLANAPHTISLKVLGTKNASSSGTGVSLDAFKVGTTITQESAPAIGYDAWRNTNSVNAEGGSYRVASEPTARASVTFTGTGIDWITARGRTYGKASITIDGVAEGTVDLYAAAQAWRSVIAYSGLTPGAHTLVVRVLGLRNASATASKVVLDGFDVHT